MDNKKFDYLLPLSIIVAALLISGAWIYTGGIKSDKSNDKNNEKIAAEADTNAVLENIKPVDKNEHIRGNLNAPIKIVEFSDLECPYCKMFHQTTRQILAEYSGKVALVFRHYPIEQLHLKSKRSAEASECAAELGGPFGSEASNEKFWDFIDRYFSITPSNDQMDMTKLPEIAENIGLNRREFETCLNSGKYKQKIEDQIKEAINVGARGTPYSIVISSGGKKYPISGAYPFADVKAIIEEALKW